MDFHVVLSLRHCPLEDRPEKRGNVASSDVPNVFSSLRIPILFSLKKSFRRYLWIEICFLGILTCRETCSGKRVCPHGSTLTQSMCPHAWQRPHTLPTRFPSDTFLEAAATSVSISLTFTWAGVSYKWNKPFWIIMVVLRSILGGCTHCPLIVCKVCV